MLLDVLAFSGVWVAGAAGALCATASLAMGLPPRTEAVALAVAGTLVVYTIDRLRDVERDRATAPHRTAFVRRHRPRLLVLAGGAGLVSLGAAVAAGPLAAAVLAPVLALGLLHRRVKRVALAKPIYLTLAWVTVVVGLPLALDSGARHAGRVAGVLGCALLANAIASNVRDRRAGAALLGEEPALLVARCTALLGVALAAFAPDPIRALVPVPLATFAVLVPFRASERYGLIAVDGALLAGAGVAIGLLRSGVLRS